MSTDALDVLAIGNSFSTDATFYLPAIAASGQDCAIHLGQAGLGGCSLQRHANLAELTAQEPDFAPYSAHEDRDCLTGRYNLQQALTAKPWDVVTCQQVSHLSWQLDSFRPWLDTLLAVIARLAPQARVMFHQTWAYREDSPFFVPHGLTQEIMFARIRENYRTLAAETGGGVIPAGQAIQNARAEGGAFEFPDEAFDYVQPSYPQLPRQGRSFNVGWHWNRMTGDGVPKMELDAIHLNVRGRYLAAALWYETLTGRSVEKTSFRPDELAEDDWRFCREAARRTAAEGAAA